MKISKFICENGHEERVHCEANGCLEENGRKMPTKSNHQNSPSCISSIMDARESSARNKNVALGLKAEKAESKKKISIIIHQDESEKEENLVNNVSAARRLSNIMQQALSAYLFIWSSKYPRTQSTCRRIFANKSKQTSSGVLGEEDDEENPSSAQRHKRPHEDKDLDGGYAWTILAVIFFISASTFGTARAYGLIFERMARNEASSDRASAAMPFTLMGAIENMAGPLSGYLLSRSQENSRAIVLTGSCMITISHFLASYSVDFYWAQLVSMGLMCGIGMSFVSISFFQINNAYFVRFRSTAYGIGLTGAAFGTFYISPVCQYVLMKFGISTCYLMLGFILLPNIPLSLLLKPKKLTSLSRDKNEREAGQHEMSKREEIKTVSSRIDNAIREQTTTTTTTSVAQNNRDKIRFRQGVAKVLRNPMFHLIWPTQLLFCWLNFVLGMIIVDFGRDRGLSEHNLGRLPPIWAAGQLVGRLVLGPLVDLKYLTYRAWTVLCFSAIGLVMLALTSITTNELLANYGNLFDSEDESRQQQQQFAPLIMLMFIFILSMFIALLYLLLNGLIVVYVERSLQPLCIGISSFVGSFLLVPRAQVIGYYRDTIGNYDSMISLFIWVSFAAALIWLLVAPILHGPSCGRARLAKFASISVRLRQLLLAKDAALTDRRARSGVKSLESQSNCDRHFPGYYLLERLKWSCWPIAVSLRRTS